MATKKNDDYYQRKYLDDNFKDIKDDIKEVKDETKSITRHVSKINGRLSKVENEVFPPATPTSIKELPSVWRDPQVIKLLTYVAIAVVFLLVIYAAIKGISLPRFA